MAPPPEYDKEPKAPDKSATNISTEDSKLIHNLVNDQHTNSDHKPTNTVAAVEVENNKHVETLDDGQLRALLDEAITYKCPKDREGKSSLFKELLEEVEQDEQACEAAARTLSGARGGRRGARGRRALPHSNSLQDLVAALAAEPAPRRHHVRHHAPAPAHSNVSARAIHGGSLPSGVDTSSLLSEEPARGAGYLATVRCVNPPPLAERRVSASDANTPAEMELLNRRSKPMFPMTYTARATLEIGSGSVCSGRAVTTTTASNQVAHETRRDPGLLYGHLLPKNQRNRPKNKPEIPQSEKLMNALLPKKTDREDGSLEHNLNVDLKSSNKYISDPCSTEFSHVNVDTMEETNLHRVPHSVEQTEAADSNNGIELTEFKSSVSPENITKNTFADFFATQQELLNSLNNLEETGEENEIITTHEIENIPDEIESHECIQIIPEELITTNECVSNEPQELTEISDMTFVVYDVIDLDAAVVKEWFDSSAENNDVITNSEEATDDGTVIERMLAEIPNNSFIFLTVPQPLIYPAYTDNTKSTSDSNNNDSKPVLVNEEKEQPPLECPVNNDTEEKTVIDKNALKVLLLQNLFKNNIIENPSGDAGVSAITGEEVDSAISFSCITTPEVVASCNTTSSSAQSAVAVDPKPRSMISSSFNGLPLSRPNYGSTGSSATDDYKKSLDENGNSVQGFSSPLSGSSQHKKPRRKKSSKNETVIDCQQIDGYQGDKDVNELLRFIESNADNGRTPKLGRVKHKDDSDDKSGKKRSTERRKDKENKIKRASSLEELSRTKIEDLTDVAESPLRGDKKDRRGDNTPAKAERRSWGEDARDALAYTELAADSPAAAAELTDFQTVTKKRKPRRRTDEHDREPAPRRARPPSPRARRESAPPSDRSNDSNDDMDSVHSLPAAPPAPPPPAAPAPPHASYAEIARTRHNIPDLIESCNFYAEGAAAAAGDAAGDAPGEAGGDGGADASGDADGYPALEARAAARRRDLKPAPPLRRERKPAPPPQEAPDVVADRRPPVILLDSAARPRDMDGVTFGFDINEQLLSSGARRPRCDLLRDAPEPGVRVRTACAALRYVAPEPPPDTAALLQLVDYVGAAWEDVVRCGGGKVRYFNE